MKLMSSKGSTLPHRIPVISRQKAVTEKGLCLVQSQGIVARVHSNVAMLVERIKPFPYRLVQSFVQTPSIKIDSVA